MIGTTKFDEFLSYFLRRIPDGIRDAMLLEMDDF